MAHEGHHRRALFPFRGGSSALRPADAIAAMQNQMRHSFRMAHGIGDRYRASLRDAEQGEAFETGGFHHGFEIADECLERNLFDFTVREAVAACVVANERVVARQFAIEMSPYWALEVEFEMRHPVPALDERRSAAHARVGESNSVSRRAEVYLLLVARRGWRR